jgi:cyclopropane-fatty-acyl-phospholipid synthase
MLTGLAKRAVLSTLETFGGGALLLESAGRVHRFGSGAGAAASIVIHDDRLFLRALVGGDIAIGESYMDGAWSTPDLVGLVRWMVRHRNVLGRAGALAAAAGRGVRAIGRRLRDNSMTGSRRHVRHHYDLGNEFFRLFLDTDLRMYSSAYFTQASDSLEDAQAEKVDRICRMLDLRPADRVLEIGSGWGGFALWAAGRYGCHVTTTTISDEQYRYVRGLAAAHPAASRIDVRDEDYRRLTGRFDKIVSIEMFEAVGLRHYDDYFSAVDRLLVPGGAMLLQTITVDDRWFATTHGEPDWIEKHIFPGSELASVGEILKSLARATSLSMYCAENFGTHYARTLRAWRTRFHDRLEKVRALGFDDRFIRMWDFYLASCEALFLERHTGLFQLMLVKRGVERTLFNEPHIETGRRPRSAVSSGVPPLTFERFCDSPPPQARRHQP